MKPRWLIKILDRIKDVVDKNKTFEDETSNMEEYWKGKISEKCMSSSDLTDTGENLPNLTSQVVIPHGSHVVMDVDFQSNLSDEISVKKKERARVLVQHDQWLYVRDERGNEGFVPTNTCHKESSVNIEVTQCKAILSNPSTKESATTRKSSLSDTLVVPTSSERSPSDERPSARVGVRCGATTSLCDSGCPSDSENSDCFPVSSDVTDIERLSELEKLLSQLCTQGNFYEAAKSLDNKQLNIRKACSRYHATTVDEVNAEAGQILVELGTMGNCALICTDKGDRGYIPTNFLLTDTKKIACFSMEKSIFQSQSMENVQHDQRFRRSLFDHVPETPTRQPCASASSLYDIKRSELKDLKDSLPKIYRSCKVRKPEINSRFSKIRNFTIGTARDNRLKMFKKNLVNCIALSVIESYTVGSGCRQITFKKGDTLITTDANISSKTWIWVHTTDSTKWQGFVPRANVKKISSV